MMHQYQSKFRNTFQHGGISMEEVIVPLAIMKAMVVIFLWLIEETQKVAKNLAKKTLPGSVIALIGE